MIARQLTFPLPGNGPAVLTLPQPLPPQVLLELEYSLASAMRNLQREICPDALERGQIEYASWLNVLGAVHH